MGNTPHRPGLVTPARCAAAPSLLAGKCDLKHLRPAALHEEPTAFWLTCLVERREARAKDRLSFNAVRLQRQTRPRGLQQARQSEAGAEEGRLTLGHHEVVIVQAGLDQTRQRQLLDPTRQVIHPFDHDRNRSTVGTLVQLALQSSDKRDDVTCLLYTSDAADE